MAHDTEATHRIGEVALAALKSAGLKASARNYELWYAHIEGKNPALSQAVERALKTAGYMSEEAAQKLYGDHIQHAELSRDVLELAARLNDETSRLHSTIAESGANAASHSAALTGISDRLRSSAEDYPAVAALLENMVGVAMEMREQNRKLETRLTEAANEISALRKNIETVQADATTDALTGVANRAAFDQTLKEAMAASAKGGTALCLMLADIDRFKKFNDQWGHQTGDQVLRLVAQVMKSSVRSRDKLARYGGAEFAVILPDATLESAAGLAETIRSAVESRHLRKRRTNEDLGVITMSIGICALEAEDTMETLVERADRRLYAAKEAGRNCVVAKASPDADEMTA